MMIIEMVAAEGISIWKVGLGDGIPVLTACGRRSTAGLIEIYIMIVMMSLILM